MDKKITIVNEPEWAFVTDQLSILNTLLPALRESSEKVHTPLYPLLDAIQESTQTLLDLSRDGRKVRDSYVIARVVYETCVNACFISAGGEAIAERAWRHARQKSLRDLERHIKIADKEMRITHSNASFAFADPANQHLLKEFTSRSGKEIRKWTPENIQKRLESIFARFGSDKADGFFWGILLYRHSSDIAHGTLFGALFCYGATDPKGHPKSIAELQAFRREQFLLILMLVGSTLCSTIRILGSELNQDLLVEKSNQINKAFLKNKK
jgi:hypothetical protein